MANIKEIVEFLEGIYQLEVNDKVLGGEEGVANRQAKELGGRTLWLKEMIEKIQSGEISTGDAEKLAGMLPGSGADSILHTDENGNVGIDSIPPAYHSSHTGLGIKCMNIFGKDAYGYVGSNIFLNESGVWEYEENGPCSLITFANGRFTFRTGGTGVAGATPELNESLIIEHNGNVVFNGRLIFKALTSESLGYSSIKRIGTEDAGAILELLSESGSRFKVQKNGNVGIGVEPYNWKSGWTVLDIKDAALIDTGNGGTYLSSNSYYDGTNWRYKKTESATCLVQAGGKFIFRQASHNPAGEIIDWTENFRVNSDGKAFSYNDIYAGRDGYGNYRNGENGVYAYAKSSNNTTAIWGRDTADSSYVFQSKVGNVTRSRISAAGEAYFAEGVRFGNSSTDALDWYEEGTWTPKVVGGVPSYNVQKGNYTRIGNRVFINGFLFVDDMDGATGYLSIVNLPYKSNSTSYTEGGISIGLANSLTFSGSQLFATVPANSTTLRLYTFSSGGGNAQLSAAANKHFYIRFSGSYLV